MSKVVFGQSPPSSVTLLPVGNVPYNMGEARFITYQKPQTASPSHRGYYTGSAHRCFQIGRSGSRLSVCPIALYVLREPPHLTSPSLVFDRETGKPKGYGFCEFAGTSHVSLSSRK